MSTCKKSRKLICLATTLHNISLHPHYQNPSGAILKTCLVRFYLTKDGLFTAIKPLVSALEDSFTKHGSQDKPTTALQLICSSNIQINRYCWHVVASSTMDRGLRGSVSNLPLAHNNLFGDDYYKSIDEVVKTQTPPQSHCAFFACLFFF